MSKGALGSLLSRLQSIVARKQLVGTDAFGNKFYRKFESDFNGNRVERRTMQPPNASYTAYDPKAVSSQWRQWLSKTRPDPPTQEELQA